jgi:hypothetical protein
MADQALAATAALSRAGFELTPKKLDDHDSADQAVLLNR